MGLSSSSTCTRVRPFRRPAIWGPHSASGGFVWSEVAQPLADYCRSPVLAPDRESARTRLGTYGTAARASGPEVSRLLRRSLQALRKDGAGAVLGRGREYLRRRAKGR